MSCKQKCKCKKSVLVVARMGDTDFSQFLDQLNFNARKKYAYSLLNVDYNRDGWVDTVQKKLKCMCKKYGCKPDIVSALYNTDAEMQLARLSCNFCKIYSSASTTDALNLLFPENRLDFMINVGGSERGRRWVAANNGPLYQGFNADEVFVPQRDARSRFGDSTYVDDLVDKMADDVMIVNVIGVERKRFVTSVEGLEVSDLAGADLADLSISQLVAQGNPIRVVDADSNAILITASSGEMVEAQLATDVMPAEWSQGEKKEFLLKVGGLNIGLNRLIFHARLELISNSFNYWTGTGEF
jgi:hypothetical protein